MYSNVGNVRLRLCVDSENGLPTTCNSVKLSIQERYDTDCLGIYLKDNTALKIL